MTGKTAAIQINAKDLPDQLLAHGRQWITTDEIATTLEVSPAEARQIAGRWRAKKQAFSPTRGAYVIIPPQFRTWGAVPASHFIDDLMRFLGSPYYVGYLSAAEIHGAAHQRPQTFQVVTNARLRDRTFGRVRISFILLADVLSRSTVTINTPTGTMVVSSPEITVMDLVSAPEHGAGLSNVATLIAELLEDNKLNIAEIVRAAEHYPTSIVQRAGWLIEHLSRDAGVGVNLDQLAAQARRRAKATPLLSSGKLEGPTDRRWNVIVNTLVEPDL